MGIIAYLLSVAKPLTAFLVGLLGGILVRKNQELKQENKDQQKIIEIQNKVLNAAYNTTDVDINDNFERMRQNKL